MKGSKISNRVSWASGVKLCQVKLFVSDDCPSKVGTQTQDYLQMKSLTLQKSNNNEPSDLPPGFEAAFYLNSLKKDLSYIPRIEWKCPPKIILNNNWHVVTGEESQEVQLQKLRETRVLEAIYPRLSAIPASPSVSSGIESNYDESLTPIVPLIPIEEEEAADAPAYSPAPLNSFISSQPPVLPQVSLSSGIQYFSKCNTPALELPAGEKSAVGPLRNTGADLITAASAAVTTIMISKEQGSLIDTDLLVKILRDPKMMEKLNTITPSARMVVSEPVNQSILPSSPKPVMHYEPMLSNRKLHPLSSVVEPTITSIPAQPETLPVSGLKPVAQFLSMPRSDGMNVPVSGPAIGNLYTKPNPVQHTASTLPSKVSAVAKSAFMGMKLQPVPSMAQPISGLKRAQLDNVPQTSLAVMKTNLVKDANYFKNLIREHGTDKQEMMNPSMAPNGIHHNHIQNRELVENIREKEVNLKFQKPCMYFGSSKGCRNGSNCPYRHDLSFPLHTGVTIEAPSAKRIRLSTEIMGRT